MVVRAGLGNRETTTLMQHALRFDPQGTSRRRGHDDEVSELMRPLGLSFHRTRNRRDWQMDYLVYVIRSLLKFFTERLAGPQVARCPRRENRRDLPADGSPMREPGFGWMNVASLYDSERAGPASTGVPSMLDNRATRRGG
jgi:hypothetical protein